MAESTNPGRTRLLAVLLLVATTALCLGAGEIAVRVFLRDHVDSARLAARLDVASIKTIIRPSDDPELFYELRPGLDEEFAGVRVVTDAEGVRVAAGAAAPPDGAFRVVLLGDSSSFGYRVAYEDTYGERLRLGLEQSFGRPVALRNLSVPGYNASQELEAFEKLAVPFRPDLVILHHDHNDAQPKGFGYPPNYLPPTYGDNPLGSALVKLAWRQGKILLNRLAELRQDRGSAMVDGYYVAGAGYDAHLEARRALAVRTRELGIPVVVVVFNAFVKADADYEEGDTYVRLHRDLVARLEPMGFHVLDLYPLYQALLAEKGWSDLGEWWIAREPLDGHPNPAGHAFIAAKVLDYLRARPELLGRLASASPATATDGAAR